jgi:hypothetical protein
VQHDLFWALTPRVVWMLLDRHKDQRRADDRRAGEVAAMIYNAHRNAEKDPKGWTWEDVFPEHKKAPAPQTDEQMFGTMMMLATATGRKAR